MKDGTTINSMEQLPKDEHELNYKILDENVNIQRIKKYFDLESWRQLNY